MAAKKPFLLRLDAGTFAALERWAADELRSLNAQIEYLLRNDLRESGRLPRPADPATNPLPDPGENPPETGS